MLGLALAWCVSFSCDEVDRHKAMTFFFDGVPPLPGEMPEKYVVDPNATAAPGAVSSGGWYVHEPLKDCTQCHKSQRRATFSRTVQLIAEVPQLCIGCHTEYARLPGWVHGPVASGDCLLCHEPHKTKHPSLLTVAVPQLCHQCHEPEALNLIDKHADPSYARCIACHAGHTAPARGLLRPEFLDSPEGFTYRTTIYRRRYEQGLIKARSDSQGGAGLSTLLRKAVEHMEGARWWEAQAYLEVTLEYTDLTVTERAGITDVLQRMNELLEAGSSDLPPELSRAIRDLWEQRTQRDQAVARLYYRSIEAYHAGRLVDARAGFVELLASDILPAPMRRTVERYLADVNMTLGGNQL